MLTPPLFIILVHPLRIREKKNSVWLEGVKRARQTLQILVWSRFDGEHGRRPRQKEVPPFLSNAPNYNHTVCCCTTYEYVFVYTCHVLFLLLLLRSVLQYCSNAVAAAARHRVPDGKICCCGSLHPIPVSSFSSSKYDLFLMYPLGSTVAFTAPIFQLLQYMPYVHPRYLWARAEPRRASARRGEVPLVEYVKICWPCRLSNRQVRFRPGFEP